GDGALGYLAGADPLGTAYLATCDDPAPSAIAGISLPSQMIRALPDGQSALALAPPNVQSVTANLSGSGCPPPRGSLSVNNVVSSPASLGVGSFTPTHFLLSPDGTAAYILGTNGPSPLPFIIHFDLTTQNSSLISLAGNALPLSAAISPASNLLFAGANDGAVHVIDTSSQLDIE